MNVAGPVTSPAPWFSRVGLPLAPYERAQIEAMIREGAFRPPIDVACVGQWHEAAEIVRGDDRDGSDWEREEEERRRLWESAAQSRTEDELAARLARATAALTGEVHVAAAAAAARAGVHDPGLVKAAAAAALLAAHQHALVELAGGDANHYFACKYALFAAGRWPLGRHRDRYVLF